ncbi:MAG: SEC-C domain-containing protein [Oscillospiraceae bacterium]|nr:SEC-C domain-containing protein [Oscillospiraceae bacterium]
MADEDIYELPNEREERIELNKRYRAIPLKDTTFRTLRKYFSAAANLYGIIKLRKLYEIISTQCPNLVTQDEFLKFAEIAKDEIEGYEILGEDNIYIGGRKTPLMDCEVIDSTIFLRDDDEYGRPYYETVKQRQEGKPFYIPEKKIFLQYNDFGFYEHTEQSEKLKAHLINRFGMALPDAEEAMWDLSGLVNTDMQDFNDTTAFMKEAYGVEINKSLKDVQDFLALFTNFSNNSRMQCNRGYTPMEIRKMFAPKPKKIGRNDPCPCGSGKKYKHCCGR